MSDYRFSPWSNTIQGKGNQMMVIPCAVNFIITPPHRGVLWMPFDRSVLGVCQSGTAQCFSCRATEPIEQHRYRWKWNHEHGEIEKRIITRSGSLVVDVPCRSR